MEVLHPVSMKGHLQGGVFLLLENFFYNFFILEMRLYFSPFGGLINVLLK